MEETANAIVALVDQSGDTGALETANLNALGASLLLTFHQVTGALGGMDYLPPAGYTELVDDISAGQVNASTLALAQLIVGHKNVATAGPVGTGNSTRADAGTSTAGCPGAQARAVECGGEHPAGRVDSHSLGRGAGGG